MHPNPAFRGETETRAREIAAARGFGVLTAAREAEVLAAHIPFLLADQGERIEAHLVRSNPIARALAKGILRAKLIVSGPDGYISPDWYQVEDKVPTWNYVAVHLIGTLTLAPPDTLLDHLERLSARFEATLPKPPWTHHKMSPGAMEKMMRQIVPVTMQIEALESTFKLNQNQPDPARARAADHLAEGATAGMETPALAAMMRAVPEGGR
ncbi:MAG: FMN-binding negative transcriptional regulator [Pseudomonadota bacterium]